MPGASWYWHNRERALATTRRWRAQNRERTKETSRLYYEQHKKRNTDRCRRWKQENKDRANELRRLWRKRNLERAKEHDRKHHQRERQAKPWRVALQGIKVRSKKKGRLCTLTQEWARSVYTGHCAITGIKFVVADKIHDLSLSIDRIEPAKGYTPENCRFILKCLNSFKGQMSDVEMVAIAKLLVAHAATPRSLDDASE